MIQQTRADDVLACRLSWWRSRLVGYAVHVFLVRGVLIDTGFPAAAPDIELLLAEARPRGAMISHQHEDHAGNAELLARAGVPLALSPMTAAVIERPHPIGFYRHFAWRAMRPLTSPVQPFSDEALELMPTPGHSPDHHVVWDNATDTLFAGDLYLGVKVRVAHAYEDPAQHVRSLRRMIERRPARLFCAHRGLVPNGLDALVAKANWMEETIGRIAALHAQGVSRTEIRRRTLGPRDSVHYFSAGDYSPDNFVRAVIATRTAA